MDEAIEWTKRFLSVLGAGERSASVPSSDPDDPCRQDRMVESVACRPPIQPLRRRGGLPDRVPPGGRHRWRPSWATSGWRRTSPRTRWSTRCANGPATAPRGTPVPGSPRWANARRSTSSAATARLSEKYAQLGARARAGGRRCLRMRTIDFDPESQEEIADDRLRLMFVSCHPVLSRARARTAFTLRLIGGLTVPEIARAYVVPEATIAQRIVRAKKTIAEAGVPFEVPHGSRPGDPAGVGAPGDLPHLQRGVLGHLRGGLAAARALRRSAPRSARVLAALAPEEPEVSGPRRVAGVPVVPSACPHRHRRARPSCSSTRIAGPGTACTSSGARRPWPGPKSSWSPAGRTRCRRRSPPRHARAFRPEDTDWDNVVVALRRAARTAPSPDRRAQPGRRRLHGLGPGARAAARRSVGRRRAPSSATTSCRASAATCSTDSDAIDEAALEFDRAARLGHQRAGTQPVRGAGRVPAAPGPTISGRQASRGPAGPESARVRRPCAHQGRNCSRAGGSDP